MRAAAILLLVVPLLPSSMALASALSFAARDDFPTTGSPHVVVAARVNDDDFTDLLAADDGGFSVLFGTPLGRLSAPLPVRTNTSTALFVSADWDGDAYADVAYADKYRGELVLQRGNGSGGFAPWKKLEAGHHPVALASADIDRDGRSDLIVAGRDEIILFLNRGDGRFEPSHNPVGEAVFDVAVGDLDGDGLTDLVLPNPERRYLLGLRNLGGGRFAEPRKITLALPALALEVADLDDDKRADLAVADTMGITVLRQLRDGSFNDGERIYESHGTRTIAIGHVDRDPLPDLLTVDESRGIMLVLSNDGGGKFHPAGAYDVDQGTLLSSIDLGRNQVPALVVANRHHDCVTLLRTTGGETFTGAPVYGAGEGPISGIARDVNADGHLDLVIADEKAGEVLVYLGSGTGRFAQRPPFRVGRGTHAVTATDFDGDGNLDLAAVSTTSNDVAVLAGIGNGAFAAAQLYSTGIGPTAVTVLDADGDGKMDLAVANNGSSSVSVLRNDGQGRFGEARNYALPRPPDFLVAGDIDADGRTDLIVGEEHSDQISILRGTEGGLAAPRDSDKGEKVRPSIAQDFDGDGQFDLAIVDPAHDRVGILLGSGDNIFEDPRYFPVSHQPTALIAGDFNEDKRPDLVVISNQARTILLLMNTSHDEEVEEAVVLGESAPTPRPNPRGPGNPWHGRLRDW